MKVNLGEWEGLKQALEQRVQAGSPEAWEIKGGTEAMLPNTTCRSEGPQAKWWSF
jgi:hypothetical protein